MLEYLEGLGADHRLTIDEESRGALHAKRLGGLRILLDQGGVLSRIQAVIECLCIETDLLGKLLQVILAERALVFTSLTFI